MTEEYPDVMVDIETTGTMPDRHAILQIAAVKFNLKERKVCPDFYDECLTIPKHRSYAIDTLEWWSTKNKAIFEEIHRRQRPHAEVMTEFVQRYYQKPGIRFWSKPSHFDFMFISSYVVDHDLHNPFHYREARDMRSYISGLYAPNEPDWALEKEVPFSGKAHNALADTLHQIKVLFAYEDLRGENNVT